MHEVSNKSQFTELFSHLNQCLESTQENEDGNEIDLNIPIKCSYMNIAELNEQFSASKNNVSLFHLNIASLSLNFDNLTSALCSLDQKIDVVGVSETRSQEKYRL